MTRYESLGYERGMGLRGLGICMLMAVTLGAGSGYLDSLGKHEDQKVQKADPGRQPEYCDSSKGQYLSSNELFYARQVGGYGAIRPTPCSYKTLD